MGPKRENRAHYNIVGVTGTPGVGKKTIAPLVANALGIRCIDLNVLGKDLKVGKTRRDELEVDTAALKRKVEEGRIGESVIFGHFLPYVIPKRMTSNVAVLRCDPAVLKKRLVVRGYPRRKIIDNIEAELIGLVSAESFSSFGTKKTFEVNTTSATPGKVSEEVVYAIKGGSNRSERLDWTVCYDSGEKLRSLLSLGS